VTKDLWIKLCKQQDFEKMVDCLHKITVKEGDVVMIPAGMPHAVGPGCLFLEIHECSDITIRVERNINGIELTDQEMFYGLDFTNGMELFDYTTYSDKEIINKVIMKPKNIIVQDSSSLNWMIDQTITDAFCMQLVDVKGQFVLPYFDGHQIIVPVENDIEVMADDQMVNITQGWGALITADSNEVIIKADYAKVMIGLPARKEEEV
jgi:mannose-6-phosphate isomerase